jgi:hypothetical protein
MASEKTLYWVALALLAVFVGNHFANKYEHSCFADRAIATIQHLSAEAGHFGAITQAVLEGNSKFSGPRLATARMQGQFASLEADRARREAACSRAQAQHARMMALEQMQHMRVVCPRPRMTVEIPNHPEGTI